ncbi:MAG: hypothetical protein KDA96_18960, partial [Planctomycetaceae bacterium]|nr:hypothetical protein [Planctomycetaceae bacterium]
EQGNIANSLADLQGLATCWGSGQLNLQRAPDENLHAFGRAIGRSGLYDRVVRERRKQNHLNLPQLIAEVAASSEDAELLKETLRSGSTSWGIVVQAESGTPAVLFVLERGTGNFADRHSTFVFD